MPQLTWRRLRLPRELRYEHMVHMDKMAIDRICVISWLGTIMFASLLILDYYRYRLGLFDQSPNLRLLYQIHLAGLLFLPAALITTFANTWSKHSRLSRGVVIWYMFAIMTVILLGQSLVAFKLYQSLTLFIAYVIVTNWALAMSLIQRIALNICSAIFMSVFIASTGLLSNELLFVKLYEIVFITIIAFIFHEFDYSLQIVTFLQERKLEQEKIRIEEAYSELQATQAQLIHSEKMASLGQLTAGIAHEIQNPLNFVNNFSEVNKELIGEMKQELDGGNIQRVSIIAQDIETNEEKIMFHGKRADAIVKSMLQHSRSSTDQKELTDLNVLCDEYLRLSYHGMRAKDKTFNSQFETDFDPSLPKLNVVPQDIGRVLLNLINNAFYACSEKANGQPTSRKASSVEDGQRLTVNGEMPEARSQAPEAYQPMVTVSTKNLGDKIEIRVKDNGNGIPEEIRDKIFQPFFTTKPTGKGTGLGLSLSYDIIKAHKGTWEVKSKVGEGTEFVIQLPIE